MTNAGKLDPRPALRALDRGFWQIPAAGMALGVLLGFVVPALDDGFDGAVGPFAISDFASARSLLETIATVTVSVAGLSFSVTVVAVQLASQQLSPRALHTFQQDRLNKATLALFLGTFSYALIVLARLGADPGEPNLSMTVGVVLTVAAFALFAAFIHNIIVSLQAATVIRRIAADARTVMERPYPAGVGSEAGDRAPELRAEAGPNGETAEIRARRAGYLTAIDGPALLETAARHEGLVVQRLPIGDFAVTGTVLGEARAAGGRAGALADAADDCFRLGEERTLDDDVAFPVRQLADVALRALSPSLNDPTTAENAMGSLAETLISFANSPAVSTVRADERGAPRFVAVAPDLDDLVRLGFEQVGVAAERHPVLSERLLELLDAIERAAREAGAPRDEIERQRRRIERHETVGE